MSFTIRPWQQSDLEAIKHVAQETAWFGLPMYHGYGQDKELVALLRVLPYLEHSPDLCWVAEEKGQVLGYVLGTDDTPKHHNWHARHLAPRILQETVAGRMSLSWADIQLLLRHASNGGGGSTNRAFFKKYPAHLHINLLPAAQGRGVGKLLIETFVDEMRRRGVQGIHLGTSNRNQGADGFFRAMGFHLIEQRPYVLLPGLGGGDCDLLIYARNIVTEQAPPESLPPPLPYGERHAAGIRHHSLRQLVPGPGLPESALVKPSVNNCDLTFFDGHYHLVYRTAKTHFATGGADLILLKSKDFQTWSFVASHKQEGYDFREPRFLPWGDRLLFYYFASTDNPTNFDPVGSFVTELTGDTWRDPKPLLEPGWVPWRARLHDGKVWLSAYWGKSFHKTLGQETQVRFFTSEDGFHFQPLSDAAQMTYPGACETDFAFLPDGSLIAAVRNECQGGHLAKASAKDPAKWEVVDVPERLDSPLVFTFGGRVFLACRRNVPGDLRSGVTENLPKEAAIASAWIKYWFTPKRTALYEIHPDTLRLSFLFDLPSKGDTAFAAVAPKDEKTLHLVNYTSLLDGPDLSWLGGQLGTTVLTHALLTLQ